MLPRNHRSIRKEISARVIDPDVLGDPGAVSILLIQHDDRAISPEELLEESCLVQWCVSSEQEARGIRAIEEMAAAKSSWDAFEIGFGELPKRLGRDTDHASSDVLHAHDRRHDGGQTPVVEDAGITAVRETKRRSTGIGFL